MGTTYKGIYIPADAETGWTTAVNANWTLLADAHFTTRSIMLPAAAGIAIAGTTANVAKLLNTSKIIAIKRAS